MTAGTGMLFGERWLGGQVGGGELVGEVFIEYRSRPNPTDPHLYAAVMFPPGPERFFRNAAGHRVMKYKSDMTASPDSGSTSSVPSARPWASALLSGLAGALTVNLLNEGVRQVLPHAPRVEVIGKRALRDVVGAAGGTPPRGKALYRWTLGADLLSNSLYFGLVGLGAASGAGVRGAALGLAAGVGAAALPEPLGLGRPPGERRPLTPLLTVAWYLAGGLVAAAVYRRLSAPAQVAPSPAAEENGGEEGPTPRPI